MRTMARGRSWRVVGLAMVAVLALGLAACSGSGATEEETEEISGVIAEGIMTEDVEVKCVEVVGDNFVETIYGDVETCREAEAPSPDDGEKPDEVTVTEVEVDGDSASAVVSETGGDTDGATGSIELVRTEDGWKVDELGIDYLRSTLEQGFAADDSFDQDDGPLADPAFRECLNDRLQALDDEGFRQLAYDASADRNPGEAFNTAIAECLEEVGAEEAVGVSG